MFDTKAFSFGIEDGETGISRFEFRFSKNMEDNHAFSVRAESFIYVNSMWVGF